MIDPTNKDRAAWGMTAVEAFTHVCRMDGEDLQTQVKDLVTDLCHVLRLECGMTADEAVSVVDAATDMFAIEVEEDPDE